MLTNSPAPVDLYKLIESARRKEPVDEMVEEEKIKRLNRITVHISNVYLITI